jgi:hypothetical protein
MLNLGIQVHISENFGFGNGKKNYLKQLSKHSANQKIKKPQVKL